jgi:multiple sugar transport system ATP-binding protein
VAQITLEKISKAFGKTQILNSIDLDVADGEFLTLVGPSGCGKSTLLRIIAGLETQDSGDIKIDSKIVNKIRPSRRDLAMVFQSYALYPHLTVRENLATPLQLRDMTFTERLPLIGRFAPGYAAKQSAINAAVKDVSETLQIEPLLDRKPGLLSGGQRQRVALGRAMVRDPAGFLMDEPLSNLDAALRVHMRAELSGLHRSLGTTFIYVTHDQAEALTMSDRMAVMMDGKILQLGEPDEVYKNPADLRVAQFVGSPKINTIPGKVDANGRLSYLGILLARHPVDHGSRLITIGLRPEHLYLHTQTPGKTFNGKLVYKENLGSEAFLHIKVQGVDDNIVIRVDPTEAHDITIEDEVNVAHLPDKALIFDQHGQRLKLSESRENEGAA